MWCLCTIWDQLTHDTPSFEFSAECRKMLEWGEIWVFWIFPLFFQAGYGVKGYGNGSKTMWIWKSRFYIISKENLTGLSLLENFLRIVQKFWKSVKSGPPVGNLEKTLGAEGVKHVKFWRLKMWVILPVFRWLLPHVSGSGVVTSGNHLRPNDVSSAATAIFCALLLISRASSSAPVICWTKIS